MSNATNKYVTPVGLQQPAAADLSDGTTGSGTVVLAGSPALTGAPTAPTPSAGDSSTKIATTAFASTLVSGIDTLDVNGTVVVTPFSADVLVNGIGPVGEITSNGLPVANDSPCLVEVPLGTLVGQTRSLNTIYRNLTGYPLLIAFAARTNSNALSTLQVITDSSNPPTSVVGQAVTTAASGFANYIVFVVMPGNYYKATASGTGILNGWREFILQRGSFTSSGDLSGSKALSTIYQNNTINTLLVSVVVTGVTANSGVVKAISDSTPTPVNVIENQVQSSGASGPISVFFIVPPGHYYEVTATAGSLSTWYEYTWGVPCTKSANLADSASGFLRTMNGFSGTLNTGAGAGTVSGFQTWQNNTRTARWVAVVATNAATGNSVMNFNAQLDAIPAFQYLGNISINTGGANAQRTAKFPVPSGYYYTIWDQATSTETTASWFEYQLG